MSVSVDTAPSLREPSARQSRRAERLLIPASFITTIGNNFQITAAAVLVFRAGNSVLSVGWLFIAVAIPQVALSLMFGRLVDRLDRRALSITADLVSAASAFVLPIWLWLHASTTLGSYLANFALACSAALFMPASNALIKERIRDERLEKYNSRFEIANNIAMLASAGTAGVLVTWVGATPLFVINSGTFIASAALTYFIGPKTANATPADAATAPDTASAADTPQESTGPSTTAGMVADTAASDTASSAPGESTDPYSAPVRRQIKRLVLLWTSSAANVIVVNAAMTVLILHTFHKGPWLIGVIDALAGSGFLAGAAAYPRLVARIDGMRLAVAAGLANCVFLLFESLNYIVLMAVIPLAGFVFALARISSRVLLLRASPQERVGRIFGGGQAFGLALGTAATIGFSLLADAAGVRWAFIGVAAMTTIQILLARSNSLFGPEPAPAPPAAQEPALQASAA